MLNLNLYAKLDDVTDNTVADSSGNNLVGIVSGTVQVVPDDRFGSVLMLDGTNGTIVWQDTALVDVTQYTYSIWVRLPNLPTSTQAGVVGTSTNAVWVQNDGSILHQFTTQNGTQTITTPANSITPTIWQNILVTNDGSLAILYLNGVEIARLTVSGVLNASVGNLIVASDAIQTNTNFLQGRISSLRLYNRALQTDEIQGVLLSDLSAVAAFRETFPIDFDLTDKNAEPVIFIDFGGSGQALFFDIFNTSTLSIELQAIGDTASKENHHLELRFRAGTLSPTLQQTIVLLNADWNLSPLTLHSDNTVSLYFLHKGALTLAAGANVRLNLQGVSAQLGGGTRGTQVEMRYRQMHFAAHDIELMGSRLKLLQISRSQGGGVDTGSEAAPLIGQILGFNTVLNDGITPNTLQIRLSALPGRSLPISGVDAAGGQTKFFFTLPTSTDPLDAAALLPTSTIVNPTVINTDWTIQAADASQAPTPRWVLTATKTSLTDTGVTVQFSNLITAQPNGMVNILILYENLADYADGYLILQAQKTSLLIKNGQTMATANAGLAVTGDLLVSGNLSASNVTLGGQLTATNIALTQGITATNVAATNSISAANGTITGDLNVGGINVTGQGISSPNLNVTNLTAVNAGINGGLNVGSVAVGGQLTAANIALTQGITAVDFGAANSVSAPVGNITNLNTANIGVAGTLSAGQVNTNSANLNNVVIGAGTLITQMQAGTISIGGHDDGDRVKQEQITFPQPFPARPRILLSPRNRQGDASGNTFAATVSQVFPTHCIVNVWRVDRGEKKWNVPLKLDWLAWSTNSDLED